MKRLLTLMITLLMVGCATHKKTVTVVKPEQLKTRSYLVDFGSVSARCIQSAPMDAEEWSPWFCFGPGNQALDLTSKHQAILNQIVSIIQSMNNLARTDLALENCRKKEKQIHLEEEFLQQGKGVHKHSDFCKKARHEAFEAVVQANSLLLKCNYVQNTPYTPCEDLKLFLSRVSGINTEDLPWPEEDML